LANTTVLVLGGFDILHWGHADFLRQAARFGPVTVGLSTDRLLTETKRTPVYTYDERKTALERFDFKAVRRNTVDASDLFRKIKPDFYVCGNDWAHTDHLTDAGLSAGLLNSLNVTVVYTPRDHTMSSTHIIERILNG
jgi:cytidyltransferase-like protein